IGTVIFWKAIFFTLSRIALGFFLAVLAGSALAGLSSRFCRVHELAAPLMLTVKSVPVASFIILALIWFSSRNLSVLISFLMVLPIIYTNVLGGIRNVDRQLLEMAQVFRISRLRVVRYIYLPQIMPFFYSACRISLGLSWKAGAAAEVIGMPRGSIGERLQQAKIYLDTPDLFAWTIVVVALSLGCEKLVLTLIIKCAARLSGRGVDRI
ncbi:MAG: ABC transporter permease subunit, partial [Lachnospiraceae bacterium]|nr:ABC transporter permease subunit [Lachnospiraceae bacterium]